MPGNSSQRNRRDQGRISEHSQDTLPEGTKSSEISKQTGRIERRDRINKQQEKTELDMSTVKCYKCLQMGHIAKACPKRTSGSTRVIGTTSSDVNSPQSDPWIRTLMKSTCTVGQQRGPVYKVNIEVEGVRTRALLDHGAQVSLLRSQLLPVVKEKQGWTLDQCHRRNLKLDQQPVGAEGRPLGATGIVQLANYK